MKVNRMKKNFGNQLKRVERDMKMNWTLYLLILPVVAFYILFCYKPMYGALIAFQNYKPAKGFGYEWVGMKHFLKFFKSPYVWRLIRNTFTISFLQLIFAFPASIILALLLNELRHERFKRITQMAMHLPHFVSMVVVCGLVKQFCMSSGLITDIIVFFGGKRVNLLQRPELYRPIYILSEVWKNLGWNSLIYVAALSGVDAALYDAASVDGANKWQQTIHVTLPGILPTIVVMLILNVGRMMSLGYEKTLLLYNETIYDTADILSSYIYRYGLVEHNWSYSTAIGLFNSLVNVALVLTANWVSKKVTENSLW